MSEQEARTSRGVITRGWPARLIASSALLIAALGATQAQAQGIDETLLENPKGGGLQAGSLVLHPALLLELGYDTNVFYEDSQELPRESTVLGVRPSLALEIPNPNKVAFELSVGARYLQFLSDDPRISEQSGLSLLGDASLTFNPKGAIAVRLYDNLRRTNEPANGLAFESYNRIYNRAGGALIIQPGGRVLTAEIGGYFSSFIHSYLTDLDRTQAGFEANVKWKFLPKTAVLLKVDWASISYDTTQRSIPFGSDEDRASFLDTFVGPGGLQNVDSAPLRLQAGLIGLLTKRVSVTLLGGYGQGFYDPAPDIQTWLLQASLGYEIGPTSKVQAGYEHDFSDSTFGNYRTFHKLFARYNQQLFGRVDLRLSANYLYQEFARVDGPTLDQVSVDGQLGSPAFSTNQRVDPVFVGLAELNVGLADFVTVGGRYQLDVNSSDFTMVTGIRSAPDQTNPDDINTGGTAAAQYVKHRFFLVTGLRW
jgi:hypothetical protein